MDTPTAPRKSTITWPLVVLILGLLTITGMTANILYNMHAKQTNANIRKVCAGELTNAIKNAPRASAGDIDAFYAMCLHKYGQ